MKQSSETISPFIMLLVPVLFVMVLLLINPISTEETEQMQAAACFRIPALQGALTRIF